MHFFGVGNILKSNLFNLCKIVHLMLSFSFVYYVLFVCYVFSAVQKLFFALTFFVVRVCSMFVVFFIYITKFTFSIHIENNSLVLIYTNYLLNLLQIQTQFLSGHRVYMKICDVSRHHRYTYIHTYWIPYTYNYVPFVFLLSLRSIFGATTGPGLKIIYAKK